MIASLVMPAAQAQELGYDPYAPVFDEYNLPSTAKSIATHFLEYPFELLKWPIDRTIMFVEDYHLLKKGRWIYEEIVNNGITPSLGFINVMNPSAGAKVDWVRMARQKENFPDLVARSSINYTSDVYFRVGSELGVERLMSSPFGLKGVFDYEQRPEEAFYGIGPDTSRGENTSYKKEETSVGLKASYEPNPTYKGEAFFNYRNINITRGRAEGRGQIDTVFAPSRITGLGGAPFITAGLEIMRDTRDRSESATRGGNQRALFSYNEGLGNSEASFFKFETEAAQYFRLGSDRRVLAVHFFGEHNAEIGNKKVPFHEMAKLGGYGKFPRLSHTLRGFDYNRFFDESAMLFNVEYRYTIWQYRQWQLDSVLFWDEGQVFGEFSDIEIEDFRESYGLDFRLSLAKNVLLVIGLAHGDEGTNFYVKSSTPF